MSDLTLAKLMTIIGTSINEAQQAIGQHHARAYLSEYYQSSAASADAAGPLEPKKVSISVSPPEAQGRAVSVPLLSLVNHQSLMLEQVTVKLHMRSQYNAESDEVRIETARVAPEDPASGDMPVPDTLELVFKAAPAGEGAARLNKEATKFF